MRQIFILSVLLGLITNVSGQHERVDSVLKLPAVKVEASRLDEYSAGQKVTAFDSITLVQNRGFNLGEILAKSSALQINTYSHNGLSTIAFRGTSVSQTGIYWNGFQLNPPNNGQIDLSLIPGGYFNAIKVRAGGGSSLFGSGNIGGSIHLDDVVDFKEHMSGGIGLKAGSYEEYGVDGSFSWSNGKWYLKTAILGKNAKNDFKYTDLSGSEKRQENAALQQFGLIQDIYFQAGKDWILGGSFWYQENDKEIPATLTSKPSDASQYDQSFRTFVMAKKYFQGGKISVKSALLKDRSHYTDPDSISSIAIDSEIITLKSITEAHYEKKIFRNSLIRTGVIGTFENGESEYYENKVNQKQFGLYALWTREFPAIQWKLNANIRQDFIEGYKVPFTPSIGLEGKVYKIVSAKVSVSRNFRVPTFNDQFWVPGGNEDLEPEHSWNEEASLIFDMDMEKFRNMTHMVFTFYNSNVDDWILWVPDGIYWSAQNIQKVWSRGFEFEYNSTFSIRQLSIKFIGGYTYARSTNEKKLSDNDQSYQKQLIYVPEYRYFFTGSLVYKGFIISYNQTYTGERYITSDNSEKLPSYSLGNVSVLKNISLRNQSIDIKFDVNNIWDVEYQAVQYNQMPGTNFKLSVQFNFNSPAQAEVNQNE